MPKRLIDAVLSFHERYDVALSGCWEWKNCLNDSGYGSFQGIGAHRWSYRMWNGPLLAGAHIHHNCGNKRCVNPKHLQQLTPEANSAHYWTHERQTCRNGHRRTGANTYVVPSTGRNQCRICRRIQQESADRKRGRYRA